MIKKILKITGRISNAFILSFLFFLAFPFALYAKALHFFSSKKSQGWQKPETISEESYWTTP